MAINTAAQRRIVLGVSTPAPVPLPSGAIGEVPRGALHHAYRSSFSSESAADVVAQVGRLVLGTHGGRAVVQVRRWSARSGVTTPGRNPSLGVNAGGLRS